MFHLCCHCHTVALLWFFFFAPFQTMIYNVLTFHSACKQVVIVIVNVEHSNDLI